MPRTVNTPLQNTARYQNLVAGAEDVESCLGSCFAEHLNAEIVLQTIRSVEQAVEWLRTTFLYIRVSGRGGRRPSARWSRLCQNG